MHRYQAIIPFSLYDTTNHKAFKLFTSLNDAFYNCHAFPRKRYASIIARVVCSHPVFATFGSLNCNLFLSLVSYCVVRLCMPLTAERVFLILFAWSCCLLLPLFYELELSFSHLLVSLFCAYKLLYPYTT